jgi:hypothetical protein
LHEIKLTKIDLSTSSYQQWFDHGINHHFLLALPGLQVRTASGSRGDGSVADEGEVVAVASASLAMAMAMAATTMAKWGRQQSTMKLQQQQKNGG